MLKLNETEVTLLDTPGHVDFSAEMERTLQVMDYAVLLISGADGVQGHVETLWRLLARYEIPVFLFINKMDQPGTDAEKLLEELQSRLSEHCLNFSQDLQNAELLEELAMCDEDVLEQYLETGSVEEDQIRTMIAERKVFPCCFGSALKMEGRDREFLKNFWTGLQKRRIRRGFWRARFKISRDTAGKPSDASENHGRRAEGEADARRRKGRPDPYLFRCGLYDGTGSTGGGRSVP